MDLEEEADRKKGREGDKFGGQSNKKKCSSNDEVEVSFETILNK
jgi:hypothetical protein